MSYLVISFYKYMDIKNPETFRDSIREYCEKNEILGRILISYEGLNAAVSGTKDSIEKFKVWIRKNHLFNDLTFREQEIEKNSYHKLVVRVRKEICVLGKDVDMNNKGDHVEPKQLKAWLDNNEDIVVLDARNNYEVELGKFKGAETLPIKNFSGLPDYMKTREDMKDKKIVMYCTGGVRCEKSSAFLKENGFKDVYQLQGGIINYVNQFPDTHYEGSLYVFDDRLVSSVSSEIVTDCEICGDKTDRMINCHNLDCDKLTIICSTCQNKMNKTCSQNCKDAPDQRKEKEEIHYEIIGSVENYYAKPKVALLKVMRNFSKGDSLSFVGKTTKYFKETVLEMRDYDGNEINEAYEGQLITIPVSKQVRENDKVVL